MCSLRLTDYCGAPQRNKELFRVFMARVRKKRISFCDKKIADRLGAFTPKVSAPLSFFRSVTL